MLAAHAGGQGSPWTAWGADPLVLMGVAVAAVLYGAGWWRLRGRGRPDLASLPRAACFAAGLAVIALALISPLDHIGEEYLLSAHMTQHMLIGDVGAAAAHGSACRARWRCSWCRARPCAPWRARARARCCGCSDARGWPSPPGRP